MKNNSQIVYKVVARIDNKLLSAYVGWWENQRYFRIKQKKAREYQIGKRTFPIPGTLLFAFSELEEAHKYASESFGNCEVYAAEATGVKKQEKWNWISGYIDNDANTLRELMKKGNTRDFKFDDYFHSTVTATSITLLKKV